MPIESTKLASAWVMIFAESTNHLQKSSHEHTRSRGGEAHPYSVRDIGRAPNLLEGERRHRCRSGATRAARERRSRVSAFRRTSPNATIPQQRRPFHEHDHD